MLRFIAILGLLFYAGALWWVADTWERRDRPNLAMWWIVVTVIGGISTGLLIWTLTQNQPAP